MKKAERQVEIGNSVEAREVVLDVLRQVAEIERAGYAHIEGQHGKEVASKIAQQAIWQNGGTQPESRSTSQVANLIEDVRRAAAIAYLREDVTGVAGVDL